MPKVNITGTIVGADYDNWWWQDEITSGALTCSNRKIFEIASVMTDLELVINSFGGYVTEALAIVHAVRSWKAAHKSSSLVITVGALAASAAANMVVELMDIADVVQCFQESEFMFHSASSFVNGGPEAMMDEAKFLNDINNNVKKMLMERCTFDADKVDEWFKEGRMGWINADEALAAGLVMVITKGETPEMPMKVDEKKASSKAAALYKPVLAHKEPKEHAMAKDNDTKPNAPQTADNPQQPPQAATPEPTPDAKTPETTPQAEATQIDEEAIRESERARACEILKECARFGANDLAEKAIAENKSIADVRAALLEFCAQKMQLNDSAPQAAPTMTASVPAEPPAGPSAKPEADAATKKMIYAAFGVKTNQ